MKNGIIWIVIVIVLVALGSALYFIMPSSTEVPEGTVGPVQGTIPEESLPAPMTAEGGIEVHYSAQGFSPSTLTIKKGQTVSFISDDGSEMWIASDEHPTHTGYDGTNKDQHCPNTANTVLDQCSRGQNYSFTFNKVGSWAYHNHAEDDHHGTVVVTQ